VCPDRDVWKCKVCGYEIDNKELRTHPELKKFLLGMVAKMDNPPKE
jgi:rubrerythrin